MNHNIWWVHLLLDPLDVDLGFLERLVMPRGRALLYIGNATVYDPYMQVCGAFCHEVFCHGDTLVCSGEVASFFVPVGGSFEFGIRTCCLMLLGRVLERQIVH